MTNTNTVTSNTSPKKNNSRSRRGPTSTVGDQPTPKKMTNKKNSTSDELLTPATLVAMKKQQKKTNPSNLDSIPTKEAQAVNILNLLATKENITELTKYHPSSKTTCGSPPTRDTDQSNNNIVRSTTPPERGTSNNTHQRWAGASYSNSPSAAQLPVPQFLFKEKEEVVRKLTFEEDNNNVYNNFVQQQQSFNMAAQQEQYYNMGGYHGENVYLPVHNNNHIHNINNMDYNRVHTDNTRVYHQQQQQPQQLDHLSMHLKSMLNILA